MCARSRSVQSSCIDDTPRSSKIASARTPFSASWSRTSAASPRWSRAGTPAVRLKRSKYGWTVGSRSIAMNFPLPRRSAASRLACPPAPKVASTTVSPDLRARSSRTSSARTGTWSVELGCKTFGNMLCAPFDLFQLLAPGVAVPDLRAVPDSGHDDLAPEGRVLEQGSWDAHAPLLVRLVLRGAGVVVAMHLPGLLAERVERVEPRAHQALPLLARVGGEASLQAAGDDHSSGEGLAEPRGKRESVLVIDRVLVLAEKHRHPVVRSSPLSPTLNHDSPLRNPVVVPSRADEQSSASCRRAAARRPRGPELVDVALRADAVAGREDLLRPQPLVRELPAARTLDGVAELLRPQVLDQDEGGRHVVRQRLGHAEGVVFVEQVSVGELGGARHRSTLDALRSRGTEPGQRADVRPEGGRLVPVQVARRHHHHPPFLVLPHEEQVDDPDHPLPLQAVQLGQDLTLEAIAVERQAQHLDGPDVFHHVILARMVTIDDVRALAAGLPRSYEVVVRGRVKFRVGRIVYLAFSPDEQVMGFAFPREEREALLQTYPEKFLRPGPADLRYQWVLARLDAIDRDELRELVFDAWRMVVPKRLAAVSDEELLQSVSRDD